MNQGNNFFKSISYIKLIPRLAGERI